MTLEEAITILNKDIDDPGSIDIMDVNKAQELGISGLKRINVLRYHCRKEALIPLPGETQEQEGEPE